MGMKERTSQALVALLLVGMYAAPCAGDTSVSPSTEYRDRIKVAETVQPLGEKPFGEQLNLYRGGMSFRQQDIDFPGIGPDITLSRSFVIGGSAARAVGHYEMADWELSIPRIQTVVPGDRLQKHGSWQVVGTGGGRCTSFSKVSVSPFVALGQSWWSGYQLVTADGNSRTLLKRTAENTITPATGTYGIVTNDHWMVGCLPNTANQMPGEAFIALAPDGTKYWFDQLVYGPAIETLVSEQGSSYYPYPGDDSTQPPLVAEHPHSTRHPTINANGTVVYLPRKLAYMYATRIEDRFGNSVTYTYSNGRPTRISGSDGRTVDIVWADSGVVSSILMQAGATGARIWRYEYANPTNASTRALSRVVLPDGTAWSYAMNFSDRLPADLLEDQTLSQCGFRQMPNLQLAAIATATLTHPSGLIGSFDIGPAYFGRSGVPSSCISSGQMEQNPSVYAAYSLLSKRFSGPGITPRAWAYDYSDAIGSTAAECTTPACVSTSFVEEKAPDGFITRYTHSTRWDASEGKLMGVVRGLSTGRQTAPVGLETVAQAYAASDSGPYPARLGDALDSQGGTNNAPNERLTPESQSITKRQAVSFIRTNNAFDRFGAVTSVTRSSTGAWDGDFSRTEAVVFKHDLSRWVIGQVESVTDAAPGTGKVRSRTEFDPVSSLPVRRYEFEILLQALTYNADGTLSGVQDGRGNLTTLTGWSRGLPASISFPTGYSIGALIDPLGMVRNVTDELGSRTCYDYDPLGRLTHVIYTAEAAGGSCDTTSWKDTSRDTRSVGVAEYGLPAGHWRQVIETGNGRTSTYYDALLQPVLALTEDLSNNLTRSYVVTRYDSLGRVIFTSYPVASLGSVADNLPGIRTSYDALGRAWKVDQDSELVDGKTVLTTTTSFLSGFRTQVVNPRGFSTTTSYQVYDAPDTELPRTISQAEGVTTSIVRQATLGKPLTITRGGSYAGSTLSATRKYVYDAQERLCKTINPESGASVTDYDAAGNVSWTANGLALPNPQACDRELAPATARTVRTYDALNRVTYVGRSGSGADVRTGYAADGQVTSLSADNPGGATVVTTYAYDRRRLLISESSKNGAAQFDLSYSYNPSGHLAALTYPDGQVVGFAPDALGRSTLVAAPGGQVYANAISYFPGGTISGFNYGNGVVHSMMQNARRLPARSQDLLGPTKVLDDSFSYDANGNVLFITDATAAGTDNRTRNLGYDGLDRLLVADAPYQWKQASYTYDPLDNIRSANIGVPSLGASAVRQFRYGYDALNRLSEIRNPVGQLAYSFVYDGNGNTTAKSVGAGCTLDATLQCVGKPSQALVFDSANRLNQVTGVETYRYDGLGRRVQTTDADGKTTFWIYSQAGQVLYTSEARRGQNLSYIYLGNTQVATRSVAWGTGATAIRYQHTDALGSPVAETGPTGAILKRNSYEPYGAAWGATSIDGTGYTGHVMDRNTGLTYMQQRYYDPRIGRFLSVDPAASEFNQYNYASNKPYRLLDPDGRSPFEIGFLIADSIELAGAVRSGEGFRIAAVMVVIDVIGVASPVPGVSEIAHAIEGAADVAKVAKITEHAANGAAREVKVSRDLGIENPLGRVQNQNYLRDSSGKIARDVKTGEGRRIDHAVIQDGKAKPYETTSMTANKDAQLGKEGRIIDNGGRYIRDRITKELVPVEGVSELRREP